jgi:hypothetical protein
LSDAEKIEIKFYVGSSDIKNANETNMESHVDWYKFCMHLNSFKIPPSPYLKAALKIMIGIKVIGRLCPLSFTVPNFV